MSSSLADNYIYIDDSNRQLQADQRLALLTNTPRVRRSIESIRQELNKYEHWLWERSLDSSKPAIAKFKRDLEKQRLVPGFVLSERQQEILAVYDYATECSIELKQAEIADAQWDASEKKRKKEKEAALEKEAKRVANAEVAKAKKYWQNQKDHKRRAAMVRFAREVSGSCVSYGYSALCCALFCATLRASVRFAHSRLPVAALLFF
jgi:predicted metal-dependent hydrolase